MLKVIIADDEIKVCNLIYQLVDWESMGLEVAAIINDGISAFDLIKEIEPDIVITDIRMPGYDGIELIRRTKEILPNVFFIIISGYNQFEYAQNAIRYGVENYLLKPIKKIELINTLAKIIEKNSQVKSDFNEKKELKTMLRSSVEKAKKNLLTEILFNPLGTIVNNDIDSINKEYYSNFKTGFFTIAVIRPFLETGEENEEMISLLLTKIQSMVKQKLEPICIELITVIWQEQIICLINTDDPKLKTIIKQLNKMKIDIANLKDIFQKANIIIGFGEVTDNLNKIYSNIEKAQTAILSRFAQSNAYIINYEDRTESKLEPIDIIDTSLKDRLLSYFETLDKNKLFDELARLKMVFEKNAKDSKLIYRCYTELIDIIIFGLKTHLNRDSLHDASWFRKQFNRFYTLNDMFDWIKDWIDDEFEKFSELKKNRDNKPIRLAKQYIHENYNKSISLDDVSSMLGFNSAYFSTMFKKETGENFIDYLIKIRINNAKHLLLQSNLNVDGIATAVGYSDTKYFTKLFRKKTGLSPSEFKKLYG